MAVVATAERGLIVYQLENQPSEFRRIESPLKHQVSPGRVRKHVFTACPGLHMEQSCTFKRL